MTRDDLSRHVEESVRAVASLRQQMDFIHTAGRLLADRLAGGGCVYTCGNGGSAAEAMHLAEELIGNYRDRRRPPQRAVCLNADPAALTCIANDFGFEQVFARQCAALLTAGDVLVALSTSGNSPNVVRALETAKDRGAARIGLLGRGGGACRDLCEHVILVDADQSSRIQEAHLLVVHLLCEIVERAVMSRA